jgi:asparagine synthase (glutamine-hydrolysing)
MCGIAGIVALDGFDPRKLIAMTQMISYRGPDGYGFAYSTAAKDAALEVHHGDESLPAIRRPQIGLGNRRLAILDLSDSGNQPMRTENDDLCITYNGEIYNSQEIRTELQQMGHRFFSTTDTEVILRSYAAWGEKCLRRFNGMWSFAMWDRRRQTLFCARDRFGVKPFYFVTSENGFYFGSEIKQVLIGSGIQRVANERVVGEFLDWGLQDYRDETAFESVFQLPAGHSLVLNLRESLRPDIQKYWELLTQPELKITIEEAAEGFRERFREAIKLRLRSDVAVGISLSGGLDSSAVLCEARRASPNQLFNSFSACFENKRIDERSYMSAIASATNSPKHWAFPRAESFWQEFETIAYHQDEPIGGPSVFAQWSVMREARKNRVPVLLGGQGGDEALCGYRKYYFFYVWHLLRSLDLSAVPEGIALLGTLWNSTWSPGSVSRYLPTFARKSISATARFASSSLKKSVRSSSNLLGVCENLAERQKVDLLQSSIPMLLRHEDRNSMAHSIETRLPFLDYKLVEFAVRCSPSLKLKNGWTKRMLRVALSGTLPDEVRLRKSKLGFDTPEADWLRIGLRNGLGKMYRDADLRMGKFIDSARLTRECDRFLNQERGALPPQILFRALSLETWARVHEVN